MSGLMELIGQFGSHKLAQGCFCDEDGYPISFSTDAPQLPHQAAAEVAHKAIAQRVAALEEKEKALEFIFGKLEEKDDLYLIQNKNGSMEFGDISFSTIGTGPTPLAAVLDAIERGKA